MNLKELAENVGLEEDEFRELVELFVETAGLDIERLKTALDDGDAEKVARAAHTINGASGNLGITNIHEVAKRIELAAGNKELYAISNDVSHLKELIDEVGKIVHS